MILEPQSAADGGDGGSGANEKGAAVHRPDMNRAGLRRQPFSLEIAIATGQGALIAQSQPGCCVIRRNFPSHTQNNHDEAASGG